MKLTNKPDFETWVSSCLWDCCYSIRKMRHFSNLSHTISRAALWCSTFFSVFCTYVIIRDRHCQMNMEKRLLMFLTHPYTYIPAYVYEVHVYVHVNPKLAYVRTYVRTTYVRRTCSIHTVSNNNVLGTWYSVLPRYTSFRMPCLQDRLFFVPYVRTTSQKLEWLFWREKGIFCFSHVSYSKNVSSSSWRTRRSSRGGFASSGVNCD